MTIYKSFDDLLQNLIIKRNNVSDLAKETLEKNSTYQNGYLLGMWDLYDKIIDELNTTIKYGNTTTDSQPDCDYEV